MLPSGSRSAARTQWCDLPLDLVREETLDPVEVVRLELVDFGRVVGFGIEVVD